MRHPSHGFGCVEILTHQNGRRSRDGCQSADRFPESATPRRFGYRHVRTVTVFAVRKPTRCLINARAVKFLLTRVLSLTKRWLAYQIRAMVKQWTTWLRQSASSDVLGMVDERERINQETIDSDLGSVSSFLASYGWLGYRRAYMP